jgi:DNA-binding transcriptional ArsR family regulator
MARKSRIPAACITSLERHLRPELFRALGDETRLTLLSRLTLAGEPLTVTEVSSCCGVHLSGVSRHLGILRAAGVVSAEKSGREVRYAVHCAELTKALRGLADAIDDCRAACCAPTDRSS